MELTAELLGLALEIPGERAAFWAPHLNLACRDAELNTPQRIASFLSQVGSESGKLTVLQEHMNYTNAARLCQVFPRYFPTLDSALPYVGKPEALANKVYSLRNGNGDEASGDGWKYRGAGLIQLTGKGNFERCGKALGLDLLGHPEILLTPAGASSSAGWYWSSRGLNRFADTEDHAQVMRRVNGGNLGLADRIHLYEKALTALCS